MPQLGMRCGIERYTVSLSDEVQYKRDLFTVLI